MTELKETLWNTLENLTDEQLKHFQWFLKQDDVLKGFAAIPVARLQRANRQDTVDLMVQKHGCPEALKITTKILEKISRNDLVQHLSSTASTLTDLNSHVSVPLKCGYERKKAKLGETMAEIKLMIQERQMRIWEIKHSADLSRKSADRHTADSWQVFTVLIQTVERSLSNLVEEIEEKQKLTQKRAKGLIQGLEQEISELTKRSAEVEHLLHAKDHPSFHQSFSSLNAPPPTMTLREVSVPPPSYGQSVESAVNQLKEELSNEMEKLTGKARLYGVQLFAVDVTLDPDTANPHLILSDDGKQVHCGDVNQNLADNPERFSTSVNVLGKQSFSSGRFYYEVQVEGKTSWDLGIAKKSVNRKGSTTVNPNTGYWIIFLRKRDKYKASDGSISVKCPLRKVGVFVDYDKGSVSFYDADSADVIHCFADCSFTEKIYPFFSPGLHHGGENSTPLIISPVNHID